MNISPVNNFSYLFFSYTVYTTSSVIKYQIDDSNNVEKIERTKRPCVTPKIAIFDPPFPMSHFFIFCFDPLLKSDKPRTRKGPNYHLHTRRFPEVKKIYWNKKLSETWESYLNETKERIILWKIVYMLFFKSNAFFRPRLKCCLAKSKIP